MNGNFTGERHWQTQTLVKVFIELQENELVTYEALAERCNMSVEDVKKRKQSAKNIVLRENNIVIDSSRGIGVVRLPQDRVTEPVARHHKKARNQFKLSNKLIKKGITNFPALSKEKKSEVFMQQAVIGAGLLVTSQSSQRLLKEHVETSNEELKIGRTLELLKK